MNRIKYICLVIWPILAGYVYADSANIIEFSDRTDIKLENGLRVILIEHHEQPTISYRLMVNAGVIDTPMAKKGLAEVTGQLLMTGTSLRTQDEIVDTIALIGSNFHISIRSHYTYVGLDVLKRHSDLGLDIFTDVMLNPIFPSQELEQVRKERINYTKMELTNNHGIASKHGNFLLFGPQHPLGIARTEKSLKRIN